MKRSRQRHGEGKRERCDRSVGRQDPERQSRPTKGIKDTEEGGQTGRAAARMVNRLRHRWGDGASDHDTASNTFTPTEIDTQVDGAHEERTIRIQEYAHTHTNVQQPYHDMRWQAGRQAGIYRIHTGRQSLTHSCHSDTERKREIRSVGTCRKEIHITCNIL